MLAAIGSLTVLGIGLGAALGVAARYLHVEGNPLEEEVNELLPGTNCGQCGEPGCTAAASALVAGAAPVDICPPGGRELAAQLAEKLGVEVDLTSLEEKGPEVAFVNEDLCIGCARCFQKCPTDALIGGPKQMHTVIPEFCTGCEKCIDICPTECIEMHPVAETLQTWHWPKPEAMPTDDDTRRAA